MSRWWMLGLLMWAGCFKLDPFLYEPDRLEQYEFLGQGDHPEETVAADRIEPVTIVVNDQVTLGAAYLRGSVQPPLAHVLFFHGMGGNLDTHFWRAKRWANLGFDVLAFDYRSWGTSSPVTPSEAGLGEDTAAARQWLLDRIGSDQKLVYYGNSFGTAVATQGAVAAPPRVLVLESGFASIEAFKRDSTRMDFPRSFIALDGWATSTHIRSVRVPVLVMHGQQDDFVRPEFSQQIFANANDPKKLVLVEGAVHSDVPMVMGEAYGKTIREFVLPYLE